MRYFKHIDIDNYQAILEKSKEFVSEVYSGHLKDHTGNFSQINWKVYIECCPEILTAFSKYDLEPLGGHIYIIFNQAKAPPHIDYINKKRNQCRINIPVFNCEHSVTEYYNYTGIMEQGITYQDNGLNGYLRFMDEDPNLVKVDEVVVDRPTIMRVQQPHRVIIDNNYVPRVVLTFFTRKDPVYLLEEEDATC